MKKTAFAKIIILLCLFISSCGGTPSTPKEDPVAIRIAEENAADSLQNFLLSNIDLSDDEVVRVTEFTSKDCTIKIWIPQEEGVSLAEVAGTVVCTLATRWLNAHNYNVEMDGIFVYCEVRSSYTGTTGKSGRIIWGHALYDYNVDQIKWKWETSE